MIDHDIPINIIILEDIEQEHKNLTDCYLDILKSCRRVNEFRSLIEMIQVDIRELTLREILVKNIQHQSRILEETKNR